MTKKISNLARGILLGVSVGILWGLSGVLMEHVGLNPIFTDFQLASSLGISRLCFNFSPLVTAFFHETSCFILVSIVLLKNKQLKHVFYILFKTKKGKIAALAALAGSPIGMSAYLLGIMYASSPYASAISAIHPGVCAIIAFIFLKEKMSIRAAIGIAISLLGSFMLSFNPSQEIQSTFGLGIFFSCIAVLGWALEGVLIDVAMKHVKGEDEVKTTPQQLLCLHYFVAMVTYAVIILPVIGGYPLAGEIIHRGLIYKYAGISILGTLTYLSWYKAVDLIGSSMGTALNSTSTLWTILFSALLFNGKITAPLTFWGLVIVIGVFIFAIDPKSLKSHRTS